MKLAIVIPAYNEGQVISKVLKGLKTKYPGVSQTEIVVINDGSEDNTGELAEQSGVTVIHHLINRGLGGALGTGLTYAKRNNFDLVVTFDADGQHHPDDIDKLLAELIADKADVVIGSRLINPTGMPWYRIMGNRGLSWLTFFLFGIKTIDSQSGLRGFNRKAISTIRVNFQKMEVSSGFFSEIAKNRLRYGEVPIRAIYTEYSLKKGQKNINAISIILKLLWSKITR